MERYKLKDLFENTTAFDSIVRTLLSGSSSPYKPMLMGMNITQANSITPFITATIFGYFQNDLVAYEGETLSDVRNKFLARFVYDIAIKYPYWYRKYYAIKDLLTTEDMSLLQTSKVTSSSTDETNSAGGSLQKGATTPTGVTSETSPDEINIEFGSGETEGDHSVETNGFVDKYTNHQQKFVNANQIKGSRSGEILREGSVEDLLKVLEKLPASFCDEISKYLQKHFIFDYEGEERGLYA